MNRILFFAFILLRSSCSNTKKETSNPTANKSKISKSVISNSEKPQSNIANSNFEILFNNTKVSKYTIVDKEYGNSSAIVQNTYDYTAAQLERMPRMNSIHCDTNEYYKRKSVKHLLLICIGKIYC